MDETKLQLEIEKKYLEVFEKYKLTFRSSSTDDEIYSNLINKLKLKTSFYKSEEFKSIYNHFKEFIKENPEANEFVSKKILEIYTQNIGECYT